MKKEVAIEIAVAHIMDGVMDAKIKREVIEILRKCSEEPAKDLRRRAKKEVNDERDFIQGEDIRR